MAPGGEAEDSGRFYCPYPGCKRSFAELWRLKVHFRAPPDIRGSGKERGHGTELTHCPKCGKTLKPGKHHVGCSAGKAANRQAAKRSKAVDAGPEGVSHVVVSTELLPEDVATGAPAPSSATVAAAALQGLQAAPAPPAFTPTPHSLTASALPGGLPLTSSHVQQQAPTGLPQQMEGSGASSSASEFLLDLQQHQSMDGAHLAAHLFHAQGGAGMAPHPSPTVNALLGGDGGGNAAGVHTLPGLPHEHRSQSLASVFDDVDEMELFLAEGRIPSPPPLPADFPCSFSGFVNFGSAGAGPGPGPGPPPPLAPPPGLPCVPSQQQQQQHHHHHHHGGYLFNFSQFANHRMPHFPTHHDAALGSSGGGGGAGGELLGGGGGGNGGGMLPGAGASPGFGDLHAGGGGSCAVDAWGAPTTALEAQSDGDVMQLLFGPPDQLPTMATIHLHHYLSDSPETITADGYDPHAHGAGQRHDGGGSVVHHHHDVDSEGCIADELMAMLQAPHEPGHHPLAPNGSWDHPQQQQQHQQEQQQQQQEQQQEQQQQEQQRHHHQHQTAHVLPPQPPRQHQHQHQDQHQLLVPTQAPTPQQQQQQQQPSPPPPPPPPEAAVGALPCGHGAAAVRVHKVTEQLGMIKMEAGHTLGEVAAGALGPVRVKHEPGAAQHAALRNGAAQGGPKPLNGLAAAGGSVLCVPRYTGDASDGQGQM